MPSSTPCPSCRRPWRASASASPPTSTAPRAGTCSRTSCRRRYAGATESWRSTTRRWRWRRSRLACRSTSSPLPPPPPRGPPPSPPPPPPPRSPRRGPPGGRLLHDVLNRLGRTLGNLPPLNMWVRTAPRDAEHFCWRIEIMPRLAQLAGLELGTGVHLNVLAPEDAALRLREAAP